MFIKMKKLLLVPIIFLLSILLYYFFYLDWKSELITSEDFLIRNNTWWTNFLTQVPHRSWDFLDYIIILNNIANNKFPYIDDKKIEWILSLSWVVIDYKRLDWNENISDFVMNISWYSTKWWISNKSDIDLVVDNVILLDYDINSNLDENDILSDEGNSEINDYLISDETLPYNYSFFIDNSSIVWSINNLLEIKWNWLNSLSYVWIWDKFFDIEIIDWFHFIHIPKNTFVSWNYFVIFFDKNSNILNSDLSIDVINFQWNIILTDIVPSSINSNRSYRVLLQWRWFNSIISLQISSNNIFEKTDFDVISDNTLAVRIPSWLNPWNYYFNIMWTDWIYEFNSKFLEIY